MELAKIEVKTDGGPWCEHNMPCSVCGKTVAVMDMNSGTFEPCWECQQQGWLTVRLPRWLARWFRRRRNDRLWPCARKEAS